MPTLTGLQVDILPPPSGMATADDLAVIGESQCQYARGFLPARHGKSRLAAILKTIKKTIGADIHGLAIWQSVQGANNWLLIFTDTTLYATPLISTWTLDERADGQHSYYTIGALTNVGALACTHGIVSAQFQSELIVGVGSTPYVTWYRFYVSVDGAGTPALYQLGMPTGISPVLTSSAAAGSMTSGATYNYAYTFTDELGRESSPWGFQAITLGGADKEVIITHNAAGWLNGATNIWGISYVNYYRQNPGSTTYNFVHQSAFTATVDYTDQAADATVQASTQILPSAGENDPAPGTQSGSSYIGAAIEVWEDRVILTGTEATSIPAANDTLFISNAGSPCQFSSLALPTNPSDGVRIRPNAALTGLSNLGDRLACFTRNSLSLLFGDSSTTYALREVQQRGCINGRSIQRCENEVLFLSDDGVHTIGYQDGYVLDRGQNVPLSFPANDLFTGFIPTLDVDEATSLGRPVAAQVQNSLDIAVTSFYSDRRYYISFGDKTLCFDMTVGGWTDTGWGFVKNVTRYFGSPALVSGGAPETIFLTAADQATYSQQLKYWTVVDTPGDVDSDVPQASLTTRPLAPVGQRSVIVKKAGLLGVYGSTSAISGSKLGTVTWFVDDMNVGSGDIYRVSTKRRKCLFELTPPAIDGEYIWAQLDFELNDLVLGSMVWEWVPTG